MYIQFDVVNIYKILAAAYHDIFSLASREQNVIWGFILIHALVQ